MAQSPEAFDNYRSSQSVYFLFSIFCADLDKDYSQRNNHARHTDWTRTCYRRCFCTKESKKTLTAPRIRLAFIASGRIIQNKLNKGELRMKDLRVKRVERDVGAEN